MKIRVESATALDSTKKTQVTQALTKKFGDEAEVSFVVESSLIAGLRVIAPGQVIDMTLQSRLDQLESELITALE